MKQIILVTTVGILLGSILCPGNPSPVSYGPPENDGVLNGPLTDKSLGHKAANEGTRKTLKMAIEYLIATYGENYPLGKDFLARLETVSDETGPEFLALKHEALVETNPALDFDRLLLVKASRDISRFTPNWTTRVNSKPEGRPVNSGDVDKVVKALAEKDETLGKLQKKMDDLFKQCGDKLQAVQRSRAYRRERNSEKRRKMLEAIPGYDACRQAKEKLHQAAAKFPAYQAIVEKMKNGGLVPIYEDELVLMPIRGQAPVQTIYKPATGKFIGDVDLFFNADKILFSSFRDRRKMTSAPGRGKGYAVFELPIDPETGSPRGGARLLSPDMGADIDCYDGVYLPDGKIIFASTASYDGVPCVGGGSYVANLFRMNADGKEARRLTFDQDGNWHPSVMENGRVMYLRWEYTDSAHYFSRVLMTMNPDGTDQKAWYGSNSYWPNSMFFSRQIPGHSNMFISAVTGHHSNAKGGALVLFDVSKGRHEADGAVQILTGRGEKVHPLVLDRLHEAYSPMFYNPYPIDDTFFLATSRQGDVYLIDVFDNMVCLKKAGADGHFFEPIPFRKTQLPAQVPDRFNPKKKDAMVLINDIYEGPGLRGVPRGTVKNLRVYSYEYGPRHKGGHYAMGMEAGWDAKQVLGTAPVEEDGSVSFKVPADTPFAMQPLDKDGKALQLMRSWTVAMPGEFLSCVGCHESQNMSPPARQYTAMLRPPSTLKPFFGPPRGFSFSREVQPVLDKYCVSCHDGKPAAGRYELPDRVVGTGDHTGQSFKEAGIPSFVDPGSSHRALHPYVRRNGPEGDYHLLTPLEFHADTSELFQMLAKGHHNVKLDPDALSKLVTWADMNAPFHGTWTEAGANPEILKRRLALKKQYASSAFDPERIVNPYVSENGSGDGTAFSADSTHCAFAGPLTVQFFDGINLAGTPIATEKASTVTFKNPKGKSTEFSIRWEGNIRAPATGNYQFSMTGDDGFRLFVDGKKVVELWQTQAPTLATGTAELTKGDHQIKVEYFQEEGGACLDFKWGLLTSPATMAATHEKKTEPPVMPVPLKRTVVAVKPSIIGAKAATGMTLKLSERVAVRLVPVPTGEFSMGSNTETPAEQPVTRVKIDHPFYMGEKEITLRQYRQFDPDYLNGVYDMHYKDQVKRGYYMNDMDFPVIRVSWEQAMAFCRWLSEKTGKKVSLPTEAQWEWACRSGTTTPLSFGDLNANFSTFANLADVTVKQMAVRGVNPKPISNPNSTVDFELKDPRSNDGVLHLAKVGMYKPNAWGLYDMHGNVAEWTRSNYSPYPYDDNDGRNQDTAERKVIRGGSWHDRMFRSTSSYRLGLPKWQRVYNTGFRIIVED